MNEIIEQTDDSNRTSGCAVAVGLLLSSFGAFLVLLAWLEGEPGKGFAPGGGDFEEWFDPALIVVGVAMVFLGLLVVFIASLAGPR